MKEPFRKFIESELGGGVLLITCGLPGTWKTETSEEISRIKGYPILRSDLIRLEVLKGEDISRDCFGEFPRLRWGCRAMTRGN
jgi:hypothetical protein